MKETRNRGVKATAAGVEKMKKSQAAKRNYEGKKWRYLDIAEKAGLKDKTVQRFFGGRENIDFSSAQAIAKALDLDLEKDELIERSESKLPPAIPISIDDWKKFSEEVFQHYKNLTTNALTFADGITPNLDDIYVPLGLVERKKREPRPKDVSAEKGSQLYCPVEYEVTQKYDRTRFFNEVLQHGKTEKSQGKRLAIIGEPGAGKTTLLQKIGDWVFRETDCVAIWVPLAAIGEKPLGDYLLEVWLRDAGGMVTAPPPEWQKAFAELLKSGKVWLLLDGVDEMSAPTPLSEITAWMKEGWASRVRVVASCRLNVWDGDKNALWDFDTYRSLEFGYPEEVGMFIDRWFAKAPESGDGSNLAEGLKVQLEEPGKERIRDLIKNPLRLTLLCRTWQRHQGLPDTQAQLYGRYVEDFYLWKQEEFPTVAQQREELNRRLGELARDGIDGEFSRFRLLHSRVCRVLGEGSEWFELAMELGWLNRVGVAAENPDEVVYAFYHPTFQEYFAALSIEDWHFFVNHLPGNVAAGSYRIFESQWKQPILLWLGRSDVEKWRKEEFIWALVDFEDGCGDFYWFRALFLAAAGIAEFKDCSLGDAIVAQIVKCIIGYFDDEAGEWVTFVYPIPGAAEEALRETELTKAFDALVELIRYSLDEDTPWLAAKSLGKISRDNETAINALVELIGNSEYYKIHRQVVWSLKNIGRNETAIAALVELAGNSQSEKICSRALYSLEEIGEGNKTAINALVELIGNSQSRGIRCQAVKILGEIGRSSEAAINALVELIGNSQDEYIRRLATESLRKIDPGNNTVIAALVELIGQTQSENISREAAESLGKIDSGNETVIAALVELIGQTQSENTRRQAAESLGKVDPGNPTAIAALVELITQTQSRDILQHAIRSLETIGQGNETAIDALVELASNTQSEEILWRTVESLGRIGQGNETAIPTLVELIGNSQSENTRRQAAESLGTIGQGNDTAIAALVKLIGTSESEDILWRTVESLGKIGQGNDTAIAALVELTGNSQSEVILWWAVLSLRRIAQGNETAIAALVELISNSQSEVILLWTVKSLDKIDSGNDIAFATLIELIRNTQSEDTRMRAISTLKKIATKPQIPTVINTLKDYLSNETHKKQCHRILWKCAEILPYQNFHQAWHRP